MRLGTISALLALAFGAIPALADKSADETDLAKLQGAWKVEVLLVDGKAPPPDEREKMRLVIKGTNFTFHVGETQVAAGTFGVDAAKKTIRRTDAEGKDKGKSFHGIYEISGDTFKTCWSPEGKEPPTAFESKEGSGHEYELLKRGK